MLSTLDLRGSERSATALASRVPRGGSDITNIASVVSALIDDVVARGEDAIRDQADSFDGGAPQSLRISAPEMRRARDGLDAGVRSALEAAISRVREVSLAQVPPRRDTVLGPGARVEQRWIPVRRVGLYVPGGRAVYPSSVVMNVVPAQVAGVTSIALVSPPQREFDHGVHPTILAAAALLGIDEVYAMGGAGAIAALAHGIPSLGLDPVDVITGPGNVFVAAAKRHVRGLVGIDSEAGPTEILIIADSSANPRFIAADLISQAEHDVMAAGVLVTDSVNLADAVTREVEKLTAQTRHRERVVEALSGKQSAIVLVDDLTHAVAFSNVYAPEHLEVQVTDPEALVSELTNAGAIFVGPSSPVSLGDYSAGSNHILPTVGHARFSSAVGAYTFLRAQQVIRYDAAALLGVAAEVRALADAENLPAHGDAVDIRFEKGD